MNLVIPVKPALVCLLGVIAAAATGTAIVATRSAGEARAEAEAARREARDFAAATGKADAERRIAAARADEERNAFLARIGKAESEAAEARLEVKLAKEETASLRREFAGTRVALEKRIVEAVSAASVARVDFESALAAERHRAGADLIAARARAETAEKIAAQSDRAARQQAYDAAAARARAEQAERIAANTRTEVVVVRNDTPQQQYPVIVQPVCPVVIRTEQPAVTKAAPLTAEGLRKIYPDARINITPKGRL